MQRGEEEEWTAEEKVDGGVTGGNGDGPGRTGEEQERLEVANRDCR